jgi:ribose transport system permease protein
VNLPAVLQAWRARVPDPVRSLAPLLVSLAALLGFFSLLVPNFLAPSNLLDLTQQIGVNAILAFAMTLVILIGGIDLSVGALVALVGTVTTFALVRGLPLPAAAAAGIAVAGTFGLFHGLAVARTGMPAFIVTLASMQVARGLAFTFNQGRPLALPDEQTAFLAWGNGRWGDVIPYPLLWLLAVHAVMTLVLRRTVFGRHLHALGHSRTAAEISGIRVERREIQVYLIASFLTALAGFIHASQLYGAEPASGQGFELNAIAAAVIGGASLRGGRGTMTGTLLGAVIIGVLDKGLNQAGVHFSWQYIIKGGVILVSVWLDARRGRLG